MEGLLGFRPAHGHMAGFCDHFVDIEDAMGTDPDGVEEMCTSLGYPNVGAWHYTWSTALKYWGGLGQGDTIEHGVFGQAFQQEMINARGRQQQRVRQSKLDSDPELLAPIEGIGVELYAECAAAAAQGLDQEVLSAFLGERGMDLVLWDRVNKGWTDRMSKDTTATIAAIYGKAFMGAGAGQFGAAGQASAAAMGDMGGYSGQAVAGEEPMSFERYCEIQGAMQAWSTTGQDVNGMLHQVFEMTALDFSQVAGWWSSKMTADISMFEEYNKLTDKYQTQYSAGTGGDMDDDIQF
jgi:hypothetical protein